MKRFRFLLIFVLHLSFLEGYSVAELIQLSLLNSPETEAIAMQYLRAQGMGVVYSDIYPKLNIVGNVNHGRDYDFINGALKNYTLLRGELVVDYLIFNFGKIDHSIESARHWLQQHFGITTLQCSK